MLLLIDLFIRNSSRLKILHSLNNFILEASLYSEIFATETISFLKILHFCEHLIFMTISSVKTLHSRKFSLFDEPLIFEMLISHIIFYKHFVSRKTFTFKNVSLPNLLNYDNLLLRVFRIGNTVSDIFKLGYISS